MTVEKGVLQIEPKAPWLIRGLQATGFYPAVIAAAVARELPVPERERVFSMVKDKYPKAYAQAVEAALTLQAIRN